MQKKEILFQALRHEAAERTPWVPFAGVHSGKLLGYNALEVLTDEEKLLQSLLEVNKLYKPDGQPVLFDLQIEAECLGCELFWTEYSPPSVKTHPLAETMAVPCRCTIPTVKSGRIPMVLNTMRRMKAAIGDTTALFGLVCGPFTLASHLRGNDIFMDMYDDEAYVKELLGYCAETAKRMAEYYTDAGMDVIAVVDPLISQISSSHFTEFMSDCFADIFSHIRNRGVFSSFFVCGDATRNIEVMCKAAPDSIFVDENVDLIYAKSITDKYNIAIGGNIPLTTVMLHGSQQDNMKYAVDLLDSIPDKQNFIIAPGCDMPYDVPVENAVGVSQAVLFTDNVREMLKNYVRAEAVTEVSIPDYAKLKKPLIEVFTLDSATCAACTYMMGAAYTAKERFGEKVDLVEYKFTSLENIARCKKMGVPNLPSMYINGELKFRSIIPSKEQLNAEIEAALEKVGL